MSLKEVTLRYNELAESDCCLSCGGASNFADAQSGEICVDLGSGRGTDVLRLAELVGENGFVYGVDVSEGMIIKAQKNAEKFNVKNVKFLNCELEKLDLPNDSVDLVISNCTINHATHKQLVWDEIFRILKSGGRFVISDIYAVKPIAPEYRFDPVAVAECWAGSVTRDEYIKQVEYAGFENITFLEESKPYNKGHAEIASITIAANKISSCGCGCGCNE